MDGASRRESGRGNGQGFGRGWVPVSRDIGLPGDEASLLPPLEGRVGEVWPGAGGLAFAAGVEPPPQPLPHGEGLLAGQGGFADDPVLTPQRKARFLDELSGHGNVRVAAARVGVSRSGLYLARRRDGLFAEGWRAALVLARRHGEAVLAERALEGVEEPVFFRGELIAVRRRFDARLLLAHLGRLDRLCGPGAEEAGEDPALAFDALLGAVAGLPEAAEERDGASGAVLRWPARDDYLADAVAQALGGGSDPQAALAQAAGEWDGHHRALWAAVDRAVQPGGAGAGEDGEDGDDGEAPPFEVKGLCFQDSVHSVQPNLGEWRIDLARQPFMIAPNTSGEDFPHARYTGAVHRPVRPDRPCRPGRDQESARKDPAGRRHPPAGAARSGWPAGLLGAGCRGRGGKRCAGAVEPSEPQTGAVGQAGVELRARHSLCGALGDDFRRGVILPTNSQTRTFQADENLAKGFARGAGMRRERQFGENKP